MPLAAIVVLAVSTTAVPLVVWAAWYGWVSEKRELEHVARMCGWPH